MNTTIINALSAIALLATPNHFPTGSKVGINKRFDCRTEPTIWGYSFQQPGLQ